MAISQIGQAHTNMKHSPRDNSNYRIVDLFRIQVCDMALEKNGENQLKMEVLDVIEMSHTLPV